MISQIIARLAMKQDLTPGELNELQRWFTRMEYAPDRVDDIFKGQPHIAQLSQIASDLGNVFAGQLNRPDGHISLNLDDQSAYIGDGANEYLEYLSGVLTIKATSIYLGGVALSASGGSTSPYFGDGSDGDVTVSGNTTLTRDMQYNDLTINNGITLTTAGFVVRVKGTLTNNGTIDNSGASGGAGNSGTGAGGAGGTAAAAGTLPGGQDGGVGAGTTGTGTANQTSLAGTTTTFTIGTATVPLAWRIGGGGSGGGAHGVADALRSAGANFPWGAKGGTGGAATGAGTSSRRGGGGGGGGGVIWIAASTINNVGTISANGGAGGNATTSTDAGGNGGGGGGGSVVVFYHTATGSGVGTLTATGGSAGTGGSGGTAGSAGATVSYQI